MNAYEIIFTTVNALPKDFKYQIKEIITENGQWYKREDVEKFLEQKEKSLDTLCDQILARVEALKDHGLRLDEKLGNI